MALFTSPTGSIVERLRITSGGNVGIGTTSPQAQLHLGNGVTGGAIRLQGYSASGNTYGTIGCSGDNCSFDNSYAAGTELFIQYNGNVGIGTTIPGEKLEVNGNVKAAAFLYSSDIKLKQNIQPLSNQLEKVLELQGVSFDWKTDDKHDVGLIAQEVEKVFPEAVYTNKETGLKSIDYAKLTVFLAEAIKEQQQQHRKDIEYLKTEIEKLKNNSF